MKVYMFVDRSPSPMQRPWPDTDPPLPAASDQRSDKLRHISRIATALDAHHPPAAEHQLPPITTVFDRQRSRPQEYPGIAESGSVRSSRPTTSSSEARAEKRPRWHWNHDFTPFYRTQNDGQSYKREEEKTRDSYTAWAKPEHLHSTSQHGSACPVCADTDELVARVVSGLLKLEQDIRHALSLSDPAPTNTSIEITKYGLRHSLFWAADTLGALGREVAATQVDQQPLAGSAADTDPGSQPGNFNVSTESTEHLLRRRASFVDDHFPLDTPGTIQNRAPCPPDNASHLFPSHAIDTMKRTYHVEPPPVRPAQSPRRSPPASSFGPIQSPAHSQPSSRTLPSPSSLPYPSSASSILSSYGESQLTTAQASHFHDLQHQVSTKSLALQTLQREHDQLLAAFSRSQIRCTTLDKKSQVSDHEINTLSEDKVRLLQQVESLETQVEELAHARDEAQQQSTADGAQWQRIVAMSSQLQARSAEEIRQHRSDKEAWERDRDGLQRRIQDLEAGRLSVGPSHPSAVATPISGDDILTSTSLDTLRQEILRLRHSCGEMEKLLRDIQGETESMGPSLATLTNVNERISALSSKTRYENMTAQESESGSKSGEGG